MVSHLKEDDEAKQPELAQRLTREIIGRELSELYEISEELPEYLQELMEKLQRCESKSHLNPIEE
jgi:GTP1/Obg family GTP-binding protein